MNDMDSSLCCIRSGRVAQMELGMSLGDCESLCFLITSIFKRIEMRISPYGEILNLFSILVEII